MPDSGADACSGTVCGSGCVDTTRDVHNCGSCGHDCNALQHVTGVGITCVASKCNVPPSSCEPGYAHCSSQPNDGCEVDITKPASCGSCTNVCTSSAPVCAGTSGDAGATYACATGCMGSTPTLCTGTCTNTATDPNNCVSCGTKCPAPTGSGNATCNSGCGVACNQGYHLCGASTCADSTSPSSCGTSCTPCSIANGAAGCASGACTVASCNSGYGDCDMNAANGCETNTNTTAAHCGSCSTPCGGVCQGGLCWTVTSISNLAFWFYGGAGVTQSGGNVSAWTDQSSHHLQAIQYTLANDPTVSAGALPSIGFDDRSMTYLRIPDTNALQWPADFTIELVLPYNADPSARGAIYNKTTAAAPHTGLSIFINDPPDGAGKISAHLNDTTTVTTATGGFNGLTTLVGVRRTGTTLEIRINGALSSSVTVPSVDITAGGILTWIGADGWSAGYADGYYGNISEMVAVNGTISSTDLANLESYLRSKYGL